MNSRRKESNYYYYLKLGILCFISINLVSLNFNLVYRYDNNLENIPSKLSLESPDHISLAWEWYNTWGASKYDSSYDIQNDSMNNIYILGSIGLGDTLVLLKYNRSGDLIHHKFINHSSYSEASISIDSENNLFIVVDTHLFKLNNSGDIIWQENLGLDGFDIEFNGIVIDNSDNIYITGRIRKYTTYYDSIILMKLNNSGKQQWNSTWNGLYSNIGYDLAIDSSNNIIVTGVTNSYYNSADMMNNADVPIVVFNGTGNILWNVTWSSPYGRFGCCDFPLQRYRYGCGNAIHLDSDDNIYITGFIETYTSPYMVPLLLCYNHSNNEFWFKQVQVRGEGNDIVIDQNDDIFVICTRYINSNDNNLLLLKYNDIGQQLWNRTWRINDQEGYFKMTLISSNEIFAAGETINMPNWDWDIILVKFGIDSDNDRLSDYNENTLYFTDPLDNDTDNEGIIDGLEVEVYNTSPIKNDTDDDLISDYDEIFTYCTNPNNGDSDDDILSDYEEIFTYKTNPNRRDSDGDGFSDYDELFIYHTDPMNPFNNLYSDITIGFICFSPVIVSILLFYLRNKKTGSSR
ncbi:MAG: hypothetical protein ACFE9S_17285 [Candidatus Hermodarchaeota archaeon]